MHVGPVVMHSTADREVRILHWPNMNSLGTSNESDDANNNSNNDDDDANDNYNNNKVMTTFINF